MTAARLYRSWPAHFALLAAIWGSSFLLIKVAGHAYTPVQVAFGRIAFGALALCAVVALRRERLPRGRDVWLHLAVAAVLMNALPFTLFAVGEQHLSSILAGIWNATTPLWAVCAGWFLLPHERASPRLLAGVAAGFVGVVIVLAPWRGFSTGELVGELAFMGAAACYGIGTPYMRRYLAARDESSISMSAAQFGIATIVLALALPFSGHAPHVGNALATVSVVVLGIVGSGVAYVLYYSVIRAAGATTAATVTYVMPLVSTALGVVVLHEGLHWYEPVGAAVVLGGIVLGSRGGATSDAA